MREKTRVFAAMREDRAVFDEAACAELFDQVDENRVRGLATDLVKYIGVNLPKAIARRSELQDYRTNPYVLMACGSAMDLDDPRDFAQFLVNNKLYMGLETSFGKSIEGIVMGRYPITGPKKHHWQDSQEKLDEFAALEGLTREDRARARGSSVWREIDKACVVGDTRYLTTVKSGPNTINDTQVSAMKDAIRDNYEAWLDESGRNYGTKKLDVVIGLTYGTVKTTNNKDNQLIVKLMEHGFQQEPDRAPGVLVDRTGKVRVYRLVGAGFWSFVARPDRPSSASFAFLEVLLGLALALREVSERSEVEDALNARLDMLASAIKTLRFPRGSLPSWVRKDFSESELFWLASAMTGFYDEGL